MRITPLVSQLFYEMSADGEKWQPLLFYSVGHSMGQGIWEELAQNPIIVNTGAAFRLPMALD